MRNVVEDLLPQEERQKAEHLVAQLESIFIDKLSALTEKKTLLIV
ncbi:hypothetical protein [Aquimarina longa]|nr:hypothetical protein [Aquimarina longa]